MDIASLGLAIDSSPVERAVTALNRLPPAAQNAAAGVGRLDTANRALSVGADGVAGAAEREARALTLSSTAATANARSMQVAGAAQRAMAESVTRSTGLARHELINLSRQVQDVGVSLVSGQSAFMVLAQQGPQIADIFSSAQGSVRGFASQVAAAVTPTRLLAGGIAAVGVAAVAGVGYWRSYALALDDTARAAGITSSEMSKLQAVASFRGVGQDDFAAGMGRFAAEVYRAERGMGSLSELMAANGKSASGFSDYLEKAADIIKGAASDQQRLQLLQQAGLPATMEWVRMLSAGADGIRRAKGEASAFGGAVNDDMVRRAREFDEAWNKAWTNFGLRARTTVLDIIDYFDQLNQTPALKAINSAILNYLPAGVLAQKLGGTPPNRFDQTFGSLGSYSNPPLQSALDKVAGKSGSSVDPAALRQQMALEQQRIQMLGELATVEERVRARELEIAQSRLSSPKLPLTDDDVRRLVDHTRAQEKANELARSAGVMGEAASYAERYAAELAQVNAALSGNIITQDQYNRKVRDLQIAEDTSRARDRIGYLGDAVTEMDRYALRVRELDRALQDSKISQEDYNRALIAANPAFRGINDAGREAFGGLAQAMRDGKITGDELVSVLGSLQSRLIQLAANSVWDTLIKGAMGGGASGGGMFSWLSGLFGSANGNVFSFGNVIPFAAGGIVTAPTIFPMARGAGLMGEAGPEAIMPLRRAPDGRLGVVAANSNGGIAPMLNVVVNEAPGTRAQVSRGDDGGLVIDVVTPLENALGERRSRGRGALAKPRQLRG
ncbi:MAG: phage tail length tape measure family protein [Rhodovulum sp.]|nr:phage tail length tape measure family protein [Rhodovulum sp.]